jgi:phosphonoacetaldehyde hydrolase
MDFIFRRIYRGPLRAVVFDWSGTTVDYGSCAPAVAFVELFKRYDVEISLSEARGPMGTAKKDHIRILLNMAGVAQRWQRAQGKAPSEADVEKLYAEFIPMQIAVLGDYAHLIPHALEAVTEIHGRGLKIGTTTGYNRPMLDAVAQRAAAQGYQPEVNLCADDVPQGRPSPFMLWGALQQLGVYPPEAVVKIGDTPLDVDEGLNGGTWTVALAATGNEIGLNEADFAALPADEQAGRLAGARLRLAQAGAHYVLDNLAGLPPVLDEISARLAQGERP